MGADGGVHRRSPADRRVVPRAPGSRVTGGADLGPPVLVTGAAGFIGSHVSGVLLDRGDEVVGFDNVNGY